MNYVRGAFSAVTSYYTSLPPINASTLTGAIDVIVVERINESTGERELACSPFHVRLGKWQVLRPGEKAVTVLVNGKAIPYSMKIGDAGEAFFVFETEEDVPEELITSPILRPTQVGPNEKENGAQGQGQHGTTDRFGAPDSTTPSDGNTTATPEAASDHATANLNVRAPKGQHMNEPTFLDLDSTSPPSPTSASGSESPVSASHPTENFDNSPSSPPETPEDDGDKSKLKTILTAAPKLAATVIGNAPNTALDQAKKARDHLHDVRVSLNRVDAASKEAIDEMDRADAEAQPPEVVFGKDVAMDMAGYHRAEQVRDADDEDESEGDPAPVEVSSQPHLPLEEKRPFVRGTSAPPEVLTVNAETQQQHGQLSTSPPDYTWEWGAFPTRSPARTTFLKPLVKDDIGPSSLGRSVTVASSAPDLQSTTPPSPTFGHGGSLSPDPEDRSLFWVTLEGKKFPFELSLCDNDEGRKRRYNDLESSRWFDEEKVEYARVLADPEVVEESGLVVKWGDRFITRQDNSPLMTALLEWRNDMKPLPSHQPRPQIQAHAPSSSSQRPPIPSSVSDPSPPISPNLAPVSPSLQATAGPPKMDKRASGTSWARWFRSSRPVEDGLELGIPEGGVARPGLSPMASAPAELDMPDPIPTPTSPPMEPSKTAPASINVPTPPRPSSPVSPKKNYVKTLRLTSDQLKALDLQKGANTITFALATTGAVACTAKIFVWEETDRVVVSDIDGTITKSDALGHMFNLIGRDWTHLGVAKLYTDIARNGYKMMYLTSRAIGQADSTRDYLKGIKQNNYQLPEGPVIMSPDRLMASLHREVIMRKPEVFKMACLRDIQRLFGSTHKEPFYAGFGNRITDALSYRSVNVPSARIFTIDSSGEVKMELLELAGYKSSYIHMTDLVDQMFPPVHRKWATEFTDFNYWRDPLPDVDLPDLEPPASPALSAVSDTSVTSRLSRLRNFSLRSSSSTPTAAANAVARTGRRELSPLVRSVVSDDRSTTLADSASENEEEHHRRASRKLSFGSNSMPGSIPGSEYGDSDVEEDEEDGEEDGEEDEEDGEEDEEPVFDDDILQTEEMEHVPFI